MSFKNKTPLFYILAIFSVAFPFFVGGYYPFYPALGSIILTAVLFFSVIKNKSIKISLGFTSITLLSMLGLYLLSRLWALDKTMSTYGFVKLLCPVMFILNCLQLDKDERGDILCLIPYSATFMTVLSFGLGQISSLRSHFFDSSGDLHGTFEYANAYAVYALVAVMIILTKPHKRRAVLFADIPCAAVCAAGIYLSDARAVYLLALALVAFVIFCYIMHGLKTKKRRLIFVSALVAAAAVAMIVFANIGLLSKLYKYLSTDGSLVERYLYYIDALKFSLHHPFGKGAYAFYYGQPQFQSAYYYAIDVHNDYLQMAVEIGIIPAVAFAVMLIYNFFNKNGSNVQKIVLLTLALHSFVDYDMQFSALFMILLLCLSYENEKKLKADSVVITATACLAVIGFNYVLGASSFFNYAGQHKKSVSYYENTPSMLMLMGMTNDQQTGYELATDILKKNESIFEANAVLSKIYEANDDYDNATAQMEEVLKKDPRKMQHYRDYIDLCVKAEGFYNEKGETEKANAYVEKIISVPNMIAELKEKTPQMAKLYGRKQDFSLGKDYSGIIKSYKQGG